MQQKSEGNSGQKRLLNKLVFSDFSIEQVDLVNKFDAKRKKKKVNFNSYLASSTKTNLKWIMDLNVKSCKTSRKNMSVFLSVRETQVRW